MKSITLVFCKVLICRCIVFRKITLTYSLATSVPFSCGIFVGQGHVCRYCQNKGILFEKRTQFHLSRETISLHLSIWDIGLLCQLCNQYKYPIRFPLVFSVLHLSVHFVLFYLTRFCLESFIIFLYMSLCLNSQLRKASFSSFNFFIWFSRSCIS